MKSGVMAARGKRLSPMAVGWQVYSIMPCGRHRSNLAVINVLHHRTFAHESHKQSQNWAIFYLWCFTTLLLVCAANGQLFPGDGYSHFLQ